MPKKGIILVMSCQEERFIVEEEVIRETWAKPLMNNELENISIIFYRGGEYESYDVDKKVLTVKCGDKLTDTYAKTIEVFHYLVNNNIEYDYVFRTNTSTYVNLDAIKQFLEFEDIDETVLYNSHVTINNKSKSVPFGCGHYLIIPRFLIENVFLLKTLKEGLGTGIDDVDFGLIMYGAFQKDYTEKHMLQIDAVSDISTSVISDLKRAYCVRIKDDSNVKNNIINMVKIHMLYDRGLVKTEIKRPHMLTKVLTLCGYLPIQKHE